MVEAWRIDSLVGMTYALARQGHEQRGIGIEAATVFVEQVAHDHAACGLIGFGTNEHRAAVVA